MKPGTRKRAAEALAEFLSLPAPRHEAFKLVGEKYDVAERTLRRWLKQLDKDPALADMVRELREPDIVEWGVKLANAKSTLLDSLMKSATDPDLKGAEGVRAKAEALRVVTDTERADSIVRTYLDSAGQSALGRAEEGGTARIVLLTDGADIDDDQPAEAEQASAPSVEANSSANPPHADAGVGTGSR
jgi:hypothetical protein